MNEQESSSVEEVSDTTDSRNGDLVDLGTASKVTRGSLGIAYDGGAGRWGGG